MPLAVRNRFTVFLTAAVYINITYTFNAFYIVLYKRYHSHFASTTLPVCWLLKYSLYPTDFLLQKTVRALSCGSFSKPPAFTIAACKADLANDGVKAVDEGDALIIRAVTLYCKAEFGYNDKACLRCKPRLRP